jgi:hypothetical protein
MLCQVKEARSKSHILCDSIYTTCSKIGNLEIAACQLVLRDWGRGIWGVIDSRYRVSFLE